MACAVRWVLLLVATCGMHRIVRQCYLWCDALRGGVGCCLCVVCCVLCVGDATLVVCNLHTVPVDKADV